MVIGYYKWSIDSKDLFRLCFGTMQHGLIVKCSTWIDGCVSCGGHVIASESFEGFFSCLNVLSLT